MNNFYTAEILITKKELRFVVAGSFDEARRLIISGKGEVLDSDANNELQGEVHEVTVHELIRVIKKNEITK